MGKVTSYTEDTDPSFDDEMYGVNDPDGTPASRMWKLQSAVNALEINAQTGTTYTGVLGDRAKLITMNNASANTFTIPTNASVAYPTGTCLMVQQIGAGATTISGDTGVTIQGDGQSVSAGSCAISSRYSLATCIKTGTNTWLVQGAVGAIS